MADIKKEIERIVAELNDDDMINERKKRVAFAKVNAFIIANPDISMTNQEIDDMIEVAVNDSK
ncbi:hypothetical protein I6N96_08860 [Enterococcus sp. BWM-S5]|uniref:Uncharacterized protein n=1 Tax=Enterococcus larvae TaxID=2794352 RepID=A0ABS4CID9_9ENTE|nr:hypothetical protein [Enterococcus larvae]MBP1046394.1 hypothetical protein [Enterococcus larvae]